LSPNNREQFTVGQHFHLIVAALETGAQLEFNPVRDLQDGLLVAFIVIWGRCAGAGWPVPVMVLDAVVTLARSTW
jgi:hypothetical protein